MSKEIEQIPVENVEVVEGDSGLKSGDGKSPIPDTRATIDRRNGNRTTRRYSNGTPVLMRRSSGDPWDFDMIVTSAEYNPDRAGWDYRLKEDTIQGLSWPGLVKETNLKRSKH